MLKAAFKDSPVIVQLVMFLVLMIMGVMIAGCLWFVLVFIKSGGNILSVTDLQGLLTDPDCVRELQFISQVGTFVLPAIACAYLFSEDYKKYLQLDTPLFPNEIFWTVLSMICALPVLNFIGHLNQQMVLPDSLKALEDWMRTQEELNTGLMESLLHAGNWRIFLFNIIIIAVMAGIGEEFLFRGVLQNLAGKIIKNQHVIIALVAVAFSAIHLQFYGFIPRFLMGMYFGYLLYYTRSLWIPVFAHFTNNCIIVVVYYIYQDTPSQMEWLDTVGYGSTAWVAAVALALFLFCFIRIKQSCSQR
jgi:membrane protease YdiL (CAAX protease family)